MSEKQPEQIQLAHCGENLFAIRVNGRGSYQNCGALKQFLDRQIDESPESQFVFDLENCSSMDSTFMGLLAGIGMRQRRQAKGNLIIVNTNDHTAKLLRNLGLTHLLDIRIGKKDVPTCEDNFESLMDEDPAMGRLEKIRMMIEAHQTLIDYDKGNEVKFRGVLDHLNESLARAESQPPKPPQS